MVVFFQQDTLEWICISLFKFIKFVLNNTIYILNIFSNFMAFKNTYLSCLSNHKWPGKVGFCSSSPIVLMSKKNVTSALSFSELWLCVFMGQCGISFPPTGFVFHEFTGRWILASEETLEICGLTSWLWSKKYHFHSFIAEIPGRPRAEVCEIKKLAKRRGEKART